VALATVAEYVVSARTLLNDTVEPYRYPDGDLVLGLSFGLLEARKLRPDLFLGLFGNTPQFTLNNDSEVPIDEQYRVPLLYYIIGHTQLRDEEDTQDARATAFLSKFTSQMVGLS
jgi:hypothetical protein